MEPRGIEPRPPHLRSAIACPRRYGSDWIERAAVESTSARDANRELLSESATGASAGPADDPAELLGL